MTLNEMAKKLGEGSVTVEKTDDGFRIAFDKNKVIVHHFNTETEAGVEVAVIIPEPKEA
jgi:hypothetical protein